MTTLAPTLPTTFADEYRNYPVPWGYNGLGEMVYARTYARPRWVDGPKEGWSDTIVRVVNGAQAIGSRLTEEEIYALADYMLDLQGTVSGRGLWQFGTPLVELVGGGSLLNCSVVPIHDFPALMDMLMLGTGVGYSVERQYVYEMPRVKHLDRAITHERRFDADFIVPDKREGWSDLLQRVLDAYFVTGEGFSWSTIVLRSAGAPLKTFGGTSSGPLVLIEGIEDIIKVIEARAGKKLRSIDALDIANIIGRIVVAGNARRSAQLALGDPDDHLYAKAKNWAAGNIPSWRSNANVSIAADSFEEIPSSYWKSGWDGDGEIHGLLNVGLARTMGRVGERIPDRKVIATNPCLVGDTWVMTTEGPRQILDLLDEPFVAVVDGDDYKSTAFWSSGVQEVVRLRTADGYELRLTPDHKVMTDTGEWVAAGESLGSRVRLQDHGDSGHWAGRGTDAEGFVLGHLVGDGTFGNYAELRSWDPENDPREELESAVASLGHRSDWKGWRQTPHYAVMQSAALTILAADYGIVRNHKTVTSAVEEASSEFYEGFLRGLFDADGHVEGDASGSGVSVRLSQSDRPMLLTVQRMLARLGIKSSVRGMHPAGEKEMPGGVYQVKESFRLIMTGSDAARFMKQIGFSHKRKQRTWEERTADMPRGFYAKPRSTEVISVDPDGAEEVYDCTVKDVHAFDANGIYVSNCGEVFLEPYETCNLATLFMPNIDSYGEFTELSRILYKIQKATALYPHQNPHTQAVQRRNLRLGQSITGIAQSTDDQLDWMGEAYDELRAFDGKWSAELGVHESIKLTAIQPSGTLSLLPGVTPGVHAAQARHYIRRVRFGAEDPLVDVARKRGYKVVPEQNFDGSQNHSTLVVEFPAAAPDNAITMSEMTAVRQLDLVARLQAEWADNAVSVTVNYRDEEVGDIKAWLAENYTTKVKSVSFLRHKDHGFALPPYETIDRATYESMVSQLDLTVPLNPNDTSEDLAFDDCEGGACPVR